MQQDNEHHIALVGGGLANTSTLYELIHDIEKNRYKLALHPSIRIFDIRKDFFSGGEAYAGSGPEMLFTNTFDVQEIKDKVKEGELLHDLADWLADNKDLYVGKLRGLNNDKVNRWLRDNEEKLANNEFEKIHFPRVVLSWFISELLYKTVERAEKLGVHVELIQGEVSDVTKIGDGIFGLSLSPNAVKIKMERDVNGDIHFRETEVFAKPDIKVSDVVIATGLPPRKQFKHLEKADRYFDTQTTQPEDTKPRHELIAEQILKTYEQKNKPVKIGCIGMGPTFLDLVMLLDKEEFRGKFELVGYSKTGVMRHNSEDKAESTDYKPKFLGVFNENKDFIPVRFTEEDVFFKALDLELEKAIKEDFGSRDVEFIAKVYLENIKNPKLSNDTLNFHYNPSLYKTVVEKERGRVKLRNHLRLIDPNTADAASRLTEQESMRTVASRLEPENISINEKNNFAISTNNHTEEFDIIVNCSPRQRLRGASVVSGCIKKGLISISANNGVDLVEIDQQNRSCAGIYLGGATVVNYTRDSETITGDVGVGAIMRHAKRISRGIIESVLVKPQRVASSQIIQ